MAPGVAFGKQWAWALVLASVLSSACGGWNEGEYSPGRTFRSQADQQTAPGPGQP
jgi:hypothetical protein